MHRKAFGLRLAQQEVSASWERDVAHAPWEIGPQASLPGGRRCRRVEQVSICGPARGCASASRSRRRAPCSCPRARSSKQRSHAELEKARAGRGACDLDVVAKLTAVPHEDVPGGDRVRESASPTLEIGTLRFPARCRHRDDDGLAVGVILTSSSIPSVPSASAASNESNACFLSRPAVSPGDRGMRVPTAGEGRRLACDVDYLIGSDA
jgi:hypothetical protein